MRVFFSGPRILGIRPGISLGREDFRAMAGAAAPQLGKRPASFVYVIRGHGDLVKIGISADPIARLATLQTAAPEQLELCYVAAVKSNDGFAIEQTAHNTLARHRRQGEWFDVTPEMAVAAISAASFRLNDPIVAVAADKVSEIVRLAALPDGAAKVKMPFWLILLKIAATIFFMVAAALITVVVTWAINGIPKP